MSFFKKFFGRKSIIQPLQPQPQASIPHQQATLNTNDEVKVKAVASQQGKQEAIATLKSEGIFLNVPPKRGKSHLVTAIHDRNKQRVQLLIDAGVDVNEKYDTNTPLHEAVSAGLAEIVEMLLQAKANPSICNGAGIQPIHWAAEYGNDNASTMVELLLRANVDPCARMDNGNTPLHLATWRSGSHNIVDMLLKAKADPSARNNEGQTPLNLSSKKLASETIELLISAGADPSSKDNSGETPLHNATRKGSLTQIESLLKANADPCVRNSKGENSLFALKYLGYNQTNGKIATLLTQRGASVNEKNKDGQTAIECLGQYDKRWYEFFHKGSVAPPRDASADDSIYVSEAIEECNRVSDEVEIAGRYIGYSRKATSPEDRERLERLALSRLLNENNNIDQVMSSGSPCDENIMNRELSRISSLFLLCETEHARQLLSLWEQAVRSRGFSGNSFHHLITNKNQLQCQLITNSPGEYRTSRIFLTADNMTVEKVMQSIPNDCMTVINTIDDISYEEILGLFHDSSISPRRYSTKEEAITAIHERVSTMLNDPFIKSISVEDEFGRRCLQILSNHESSSTKYRKHLYVWNVSGVITVATSDDYQPFRR